MIGKNSACQSRISYHGGKGKNPVMVTVHRFIFLRNCTHEITNSFKQMCVLFPV